MYKTTALQFLDLNIHLINNKLYLDIYDKWTDFKFNVNTFTHFNSCLHTSVYRNIILNHLYRFKNLCSLKYKSKNINHLIYLVLQCGFLKKIFYSLIYR